MEFLLTFYVYPLPEKMVLSKELGFCLDNPRTELEIAFVKDYLLRAYESGYDYRLPVDSEEPIVTLEGILFDFRDNLSSEDRYVAKVFESYSRDEIFEFIAKMWIIARFDDKGIGQRLREEHRRMREEGIQGFFMLEDDHPIMSASKNLSNYCHLLALLVHSEKDEYFGRPLLVEPELIDRTQPTGIIWREFMLFGMASHHYPDARQDSLDWTFFPYVRENVQKVAIALEEAFQEGLGDKLLYVGNLLKIAAHEARETRLRIVVLTSIIELLLTHSPDFHRFNVEDSISKQFRLKASLLVYLNDRSRDIDAVSRRLKTIYNQRSNIAHGNFKAVDKYIGNLSKKEGEEEYLDDLVVDLYTYIRAILEEYLKDHALVEFLKDN